MHYFPLDAYHATFEPALSEAAGRVVRSGRYLCGEETAQFEAEWAAEVGDGFCVGVANGYDALTLTLLAARRIYGWPDGAEVVVPAMTFFASAGSVLRAGLKLRLCDVGPLGVSTRSDFEAALTERTVALMPVHLYGMSAPREEIFSLAAEHGLFVLEDAAQRHAAFECLHINSARAFSFYPGKNLGALGDGGAVTTSHADLAREVRMLANYGAASKYEHVALGLNSRMDEIQAAMLRVKLRRLKKDTARRREVAYLYHQNVRTPHCLLPHAGREAESVFHILPVLTPHRDELQQYLTEHGVETLCHYPRAIHQQPCLRESGTYPMAERFAREELSLPVHPLLTDEEVLEACRLLNEFRPIKTS